MTTAAAQPAAATKREHSPADGRAEWWGATIQSASSGKTLCWPRPSARP